MTQRKSEVTRRETLQLMLAAGAASSLAGFSFEGDAMAEPIVPSIAPAHRGRNEVKPLPFAPSKLTGLSEKLITSHHQNNYTGAVKRLNLIQQQIGSLAADAPPYQLGALKREELVATNSMILHELYFGNLGGAGKASGKIVDLLKAEYGTLEAWDHEFRLAAMSLAGGSGWMILDYDPHSGRVHSHWAADHTNSLAGGVPLLVLDMYEHSYHIDYSANARGYVDAFFQNVNWDEVNKRSERAAKLKA